MNRRASLIALLLLWTPLATQAQDKTQRDSALGGGANVTITLIDQNVTDEALQLRYQIGNGSAQDVWVCGNLEIHCCGVHLAQDNETLLIQRRLDLRAERLPGVQPSARYIRLRKGESRTELVSFSLPIQPENVVSESRERQPLEHARRIVLEVGYYAGDLPGRILNILHEAEMAPKTYPRDLRIEDYDPSFFFGSTMQGFLSHNNEGRASKGEWVSVPYTWQTLKGEQVLRLTVDGVRIPYLEQDRPVPRPDLTECTRIEMKFTTPALEFFFPYAAEQNLISPAERLYLQFLDTIVVKDQELLKSLAAEIQEGLRDSFVWEHGMAELTCYRSDKRLMSLRVYDCSKIVTSHGQVIQYEFPDGLRSLSRITAQVQSLDLRVHCAANLQDLWYRLRLYHKVKAATPGGSDAETQGPYPRPAKWCDDVSSAYWRLGKAIPRPFKCPGAGEGTCHYAMNPNCTYNSPADVVLLFETKAGWNRHGGAKLFAFDNHDPRGGCALLNDGTVKFVRTEEELRQLRWQ